MIVKTFTGATVREALAKVRDTFGPDAVILDTKFGAASENRMQRDGVSVTAAHETVQFEAPDAEGAKSLTVDESLDSGADRPQRAPESSSVAVGIDPTVRTEAVPLIPTDQSLAEAVLDLGTQLRSLKIVPSRDIRSELIAWLTTQPALVRDLVEAFATHICDTVPVPRPFLDDAGKGKTVLFVGARGCGKSNALLKLLAARWQMRMVKPRVLILSGANEHGQERIMAWSERCDIDARAYSMADAPRLRTLRRAKAEDLFVEYVPTANESADTDAARRLLRALKPDTVVQVVSSAGSRAAWRAELRRLSAFNPTHLVISHWDAHPSWWDLAQLAIESKLHPAYRVFGFEPVAEYDAFTTTALHTGISERLHNELGIVKPTSEERRVS